MAGGGADFTGIRWIGGVVASSEQCMVDQRAWLLAGGSVLAATIAIIFGITWLAVATIVVLDAYLFFVLLCAAILGATRVEPWPGLPDRRIALFAAPLMYLALVIAFATLYRAYGSESPHSQAAFYESYMNMTTFSYSSDYFVTRELRFVAMYQVTNAVLMLICVFPLVISRIADLKTPPSA